MAADYDNAEVTERERQAADKQKQIAAYNADQIRNQLDAQRANYDMANKQNRALADVQLKQNRRKNEADRFEAYRKLQNSALGLTGSMGPEAMNSSSTANLTSMVNNRMDSDNATYWEQLQTNNDQVENTYTEALNQNRVAESEAIANARKGIADIESDLAANLNNINPSLYVAPGTNEADLGSASLPTQHTVNRNDAVLSGYLMPNTSAQTARQSTQRNTLQGNDYFSRLLNGFGNRRMAV